MSKISPLLVIFLLSASCDNPVFNINLKSIDINPPVIMDIIVVNSREITILTDEDCFINEEALKLEPDCGKLTISINRNSISIILENEQQYGQRYIFEGSLEDKHGNLNKFIYDYYAPNALLPGMVINEFTSQGTSAHPDMVEIYIKEEGNMAGVCIYEGTRLHTDNILIFPDMEVHSGDFILVHFKPQNIPEEINEICSKSESGGLDSSDSAWDFWVNEGDGLSGNNSCITLYTNPYGDMFEAVIYSNRTSDSDENYRGFGSRVNMENADEIYNNGQWFSQEDLIKPEDAVSSEFTTSTRSICRSSSSFDSNNKTDWHTVPTRGSSFGETNTDEVY